MNEAQQASALRDAASQQQASVLGMAGQATAPEPQPFMDFTREKLMSENQRLAAVIYDLRCFVMRYEGTPDNGAEVGTDKEECYGVRGIDQEFSILDAQITDLIQSVTFLKKIA